MPIRINLLAEQLAAEDLKRRDPVKRGLWVAGCLVSVVLAWAAVLQVKLMRARAEVADYEARFKQIEAHYGLARVSSDRALEARRRIGALQQLAAHRFLWATPLNALQFSMVDEIQFLQLRTEQNYTVTEGTKPVTNASGVIRGRPATSKEKVALIIEAKDFSTKAGDQIFKFQEAINDHPYFRTNLSKVELIGRSPVTTTSTDSSRPFVVFNLECQYPEKVR